MMVDDAGRGVCRGRNGGSGGRSGGGRSSGGARIPVAASGLGLVRGVAATPPQRSFSSVGPVVEGRSYFQWPQQLGRWNGTKFVVSPNCLSTLKLMDTKLREEAAVKSQRIRRLLSKPETLKKNIIPVLVESTEIPPVFDPVVRLLVNVTTPLEELVDAERCSQNKNGRNLLKRLSKTSLEIKKTFLDWRTTQAVVKSIKAKVTKDIENGSLSNSEVASVCLNLTLIRNLLYVPDAPQCNRFRVNEENLKSWIEIKNKIAWNLIIHGLDGVLILMINSVHKERWALTIVQIIAFIFKEQDVAVLQKQLSECLVSVEENSSAEDDSSKSKSRLANEDSNGSDEVIESGKKRETAKDSVRCGGVTAKEIEQANATREKKTESEGGGSSSSSGNQDDSGFSQSDFNSSSPESSNSNGSSSKEQTSFNSSTKGSPQTGQSLDSPKDQKSNPPARASGDSKKPNSPHSSSESAMSYSSNGQFSSSGSDNDGSEGHTKGHIKHPHHKASSKHRAMHSKDSPSNSDSSMEPDVQNRSLKQRTHSSRKSSSTINTMGRVHKYPCTASVCLDAAKSACRSSALARDVLWERKKRLMLRDDSAEVPSQDEFSNALAAFTVAFLHSAFSTLVVTLRQVYISTKGRNIFNISWLIAYFMRLSVAMELPFHHIRAVLTPDIVGLLVYEAINSHRNHNESGGFLESDRRNHQCLIKAIRELISSADQFCYKEDVLHILAPIVQMEDLRHSLLYFIRKPIEPRLAILSDAIAANHHLMILMDWCNRLHDIQLDVRQHLQLFSNREVMDSYGDVLRNFRHNCAFVNHCVLTMMQHVAVDLDDPDTLMTPKTLCCFVELLNEPQIRIPERFESFMNAMINRYLKLNRHPRSSTTGCTGDQRSPGDRNSNSTNSESNMSMDSSSNGSTSSLHRKNRNNHTDSNDREDEAFGNEPEKIKTQQSLLECYQKFSKNEDPIGSMIEHYREKGIHLERDEILDKLVHLQMESHQEQMISNDINQLLFETEDSSSSQGSNTSFEGRPMRSCASESDNDTSNRGSSRPQMSLESILNELTKQGRTSDVLWIQKVLLEVTHIKLINQYKRASMHSAIEAISMYSFLLDRDTPVVDFTCQQSQALRNETFLSLVHQVGLKVSPQKQISAPRELSMRQLVENASKLSFSTEQGNNSM